MATSQHPEMMRIIPCRGFMYLLYIYINMFIYPVLSLHLLFLAVIPMGIKVDGYLYFGWSNSNWDAGMQMLVLFNPHSEVVQVNPLYSCWCTRGAVISWFTNPISCLSLYLA
jgi:hypothetical protein